MNIHQRMHAVMKELEGINLVKTSGLKFKIIQHDDVTAALRPLYLKHGILQQVSLQKSEQLDGGTTELHVRVAWINIDEPTDVLWVNSIGHASSNFVKDGVMRRDDLGVGKALSYAVKMAQLKNFALLSGDEDLEQGQAQKPQEPLHPSVVEQAMNMLAQATTPEQFKLAADNTAQISGRLTPEQSKIMGDAWLAAKNRVSKPVEQQSAPLPPELGGQDTRSTYEKVTGDKHLDPSIVGDLMTGYANVRTLEEFQAMRKRVSGVYDKLSAPQKQILKEKDAAAENLLKMQREAAAQ